MNLHPRNKPWLKHQTVTSADKKSPTTVETGKETNSYGRHSSKRTMIHSLSTTTVYPTTTGVDRVWSITVISGNESTRRSLVINLAAFSGQIRGAAHQVCNLQFQTRSKKIPLFFHNGSRFDNTLLVPLLQKYPGLFQPGKIIASNLEHFKSVSVGWLKVV